MMMEGGEDDMEEKPTCDGNCEWCSSQYRNEDGPYCPQGQW